MEVLFQTSTFEYQARFYFLTLRTETKLKVKGEKNSHCTFPIMLPASCKDRKE